MTHRKLLTFTCLSFFLAACGGSDLFTDDGAPAPCADADGDGVCDDIAACADGDADGICDDVDLCLGDDAAGDADDDGICDEGDACAGDDATGDDDGDGVCDDIDTCVGDDALGDADADGVCDDEDACTGDDALGDADADGVCDDLDACTGDDVTGDADGDLICDDRDLCHGDDATGDSDGSGTCDGAVAAMAGPWSLASSPGSFAGAGSPLVRDLDGDGDPDVATRHHNQRRLVEWTNSNGVLAEGPSVATSCKPLDHDLADLDGDGDLDLVAGGVASDTLIFATNLGSEGYGDDTTIAGSHFSSIIAMPVDGDARPDLVAFDKNAQALVLHLNTTDGPGVSFDGGTLIDASLSSNAFSGPGLAAVDVDADGDLDLVVSASELTLYVNDGGTFAAPVTVDVGNFGSAIYTADLDRDGDEDVLGVQNGNAVWYENLGDGGFGPRQTMAEGSFSGSLAVGDLDGDGDTDVVVRDSSNDELIWIENGLNGLIVRGPIGSAPSTFAIADLDGDGDGDVVALDPANNGLSTLLNPLL